MSQSLPFRSAFGRVRPRERRPFGVRGGQKENEFLAAVAGDHVAGPGDRLRHQRRQRLQALVARLMAIAVVEGFEVVHVGHDQEREAETDVRRAAIRSRTTFMKCRRLAMPVKPSCVARCSSFLLASSSLRLTSARSLVLASIRTVSSRSRALNLWTRHRKIAEPGQEHHHSDQSIERLSLVEIRRQAEIERSARFVPQAVVVAGDHREAIRPGGDIRIIGSRRIPARPTRDRIPPACTGISFFPER